MEFQEDELGGREGEREREPPNKDELTMCFTISISKIGLQVFSSFITIILTLTLCRSELNIFIPGRDIREADPNLLFVWRTDCQTVPGSTFRSLLELLLPAGAESAGTQRSTQLSQETCLTPRCWSL